MTIEKKQMDRRTFIKATTLGGASLALSAGMAGNALAADAEKEVAPNKMPTRVLGKTGVSVPILGLGGIDWTTNQSLLRMAFNMGVTHWDAASSYENGKTELGLGQYFAKYPEDRKNVFLVTKASRTTEPKEMTALLAQSLERLQTDYIDLYFLQGLTDPNVLTPEVKAWADAKKKEGKIKFFGFASHSNMAPMLMASATLGWIDAVMMTYNFQNMNNDDMKEGMDAIAKAGIGFIAMKSQGRQFRSGPPQMPLSGREGRPAGEEGPPQGRPQGPPPGMPQQASSEPEDLSAMQHFMDKGYTLEQAKMKVLWEDERVAVSLSKISNLAILKDNVAAATDSRKLSSLDRKVLNRLANSSCNFYCQACMRCESAMSTNTRIPDVMRYMMYYNSYGEKYEAKALFRQMPEDVRNTLANNDFSRAERVCPNKIQIGSAMREAVRLLG